MKAAVNPRGLPCTQALHLSHFSQRSLSPPPSHLTPSSPALGPLSSPPKERRAARGGSHSPRAAELAGSSWPSTNRPCPSNSPFSFKIHANSAFCSTLESARSNTNDGLVVFARKPCPGCSGEWTHPQPTTERPQEGRGGSRRGDRVKAARGDSERHRLLQAVASRKTGVLRVQEVGLEMRASHDRERRAVHRCTPGCAWQDT